MKQVYHSLHLALIAAVFSLVPKAEASNPLEQGLTDFQGSNSGLRDDVNLIQYIGTIISWLLGLVGTVFFVLILVNGLKYMTAGGDSSKSKEAVSGITNAIIGLVIVMASFLITQYVASAALGNG